MNCFPRRVESWYSSLAARFDDRRLLAPEYLYYLWCLARLRPEQDQRPPGEIAPGPVAIPGPGERTWPARPSLLVWGRGNRWTPVPRARELHQRIPDAWLRVIEHSKGIPQLEQYLLRGTAGSLPVWSELAHTTSGMTYGRSVYSRARDFYDASTQRSNCRPPPA